MTDKLTVVLDVNIIVSGFLRGGGTPLEIVRHWEAERVRVVLSEHIIATVLAVWDRPLFAMRADRIHRALAVELMYEQAVLVVPDPSVEGITDDQEDDAVLGTAVAAGADYLVTGDQGLLAIGSHAGVTIVTARQFLEILDTE
ncbi:MAG TPA: putative toxin-antitoxin system toxin component, PIN family [Thermomicrobiales bacterium]|nr:putative toxin-antitoxin system toxin component, PIN family [Thermomicrobiales bacterium]